MRTDEVHKFSERKAECSVLEPGGFVKHFRVQFGLRQLAGLLVFFSAASVPNISQAEFACMAGPSSGQTSLLEDGAGQPYALWVGIDCGSSLTERVSAEEKPPAEKNDQSPRFEPLPDAADCGCGSPTSSTSGSSGAGAAGLLAATVVVPQENPCQRTQRGESLTLPSPPILGLLDPPKTTD